MVDKIVNVPSSAVADEIGKCDPAELEAAEDALRRWLGARLKLMDGAGPSKCHPIRNS
jgi:hypothetical protein